MASKAKANNGNVMVMYKSLLDVQLFTSKSKLCNAFTGKLATPSEECGMLDCHAVGESKLLSYFTSRIMHKPSVNTPVRQEKLQTMGNLRKRKKTRTTKPHKLILSALKAQLLEAQKLNSAPEIHEQFYFNVTKIHL